MTYLVSADYARENFDLVIQKAQEESEGVVIVQGDKNFVLVEQSKLKDLQEELQEAKQFEQLSNLFKDRVS